MTATTTSRRSRFILGLAGAATLLVAWQLISLVVSPAILASPWDTCLELGRLVASGALLRELLVTLRRLLLALVIAGGVGFVLGMVAGVRPGVRAFLEPVRWLVMTIPAVVIALLAMLWFGLGDVAVVFLVVAVATPTVYVNTMEGVQTLDVRLLEMAQVYRLPRWLLFREIYLPGIGSPVAAGLTLATGSGVRAVVLGEVLAAQSGVGHAFSRAMSYLNAPEIFAWVLVAVGLMAVLEFAVLRPIRARALRWKH